MQQGRGRRSRPRPDPYPDADTEGWSSSSPAKGAEGSGTHHPDMRRPDADMRRPDADMRRDALLLVIEAERGRGVSSMYGLVSRRDAYQCVYSQIYVKLMHIE